MKISVGFVITVIVIFSFMIFAGYTLGESQSKLRDFCNDYGYESFTIESGWGWEKRYCVGVEDNYKTMQEISRCGKEWCFIKRDVNCVEGEK